MRKLTQKRTHREFLEDFEKMQPELFSKLEILSEYINVHSYLLVRDEFGICKVKPLAIMKGSYSGIDNSVNKTDYFRAKLKKYQPDLYASIEILSDYILKNKYIKIKNKYGICEVYPANLLNGVTPTIKSAIDKDSYFKNVLLEKDPTFFEKFTITSPYITNDHFICVKDDFGLCKIQPNNLLIGSRPSILGAINKTKYFINKANLKHNNNYTYEFLNYVEQDLKVIITCKKHGNFTQRASAHLDGQGCPECKIELLRENFIGYKPERWKEVGSKSKNFESFKIYIIKCWNNNELFYKIGKTFTKIEKRFPSKFEMPYKYFIMYTESGDSDFICKLEKNLHKRHKKYKYLPKISFHGETECFSELKI